MNKIIGLLLLFFLLFSSCNPLPSPTAPLNSTATPIPLALNACPAADGTVNAECGVLSVPEDRSNPNSRILDLAVVVVRAREANPEPDPLFYIAGGPGVFATHSSIVNSVNSFFSGVNARRDIVFLDQRGTNDKHRLACDFSLNEVSDITQQQVNDQMKTCLANVAGDPRFYTTAVAMRDLDDARAALGYDKINLYGISYGVAAEQVYMRMFPEHVRAVVMDHGTALDLPLMYIKPRASQYALDQILAYCDLDDKCHAAYPNIHRDWKTVFDRLSKGPVVTGYIAPGMDTYATVTLEGLAEAIHQMLFGSQTYAQVPFLIHTLAANEDWTPIVKSYNEQQGSSDGGNNPILLMQFEILCFEPAFGAQPDQVARFSPGSYYLSQGTHILQLEQKICNSLPAPDSSLIYGPGKPAPLSALIFNSLTDPQEPPSNMDLALKEFTKSRVIVEPIAGHEPSLERCRWDIVAQYIEQGSVDGLDISCLEEIKPTFVIEE